MVTSVIELADKLYKASISIDSTFANDTVAQATSKAFDITLLACLSRVCCNANDLGLPLSVVEQLLKGTNYEQLLS